MICLKCYKEIEDDSVYCRFCGKKQSINTRTQKSKSRGNGQGTVVQLPNKKWRAVVTLGFDGEKCIRKTKSGFRTKKEALEYLPILKSEPQVTKDITLNELYTLWKDKKYASLSKSKQTHYNTAWRRLEKIRFRKIKDLTLEEMQELVDAAPGEYYPKRDIKVLLSHLYKIALKYEYIDKNRAEFIDLPDCETAKKDAFSKAEREVFWNDYQSGNHFTGYILIMIYTGMRIGELYSILKDNVHLDEHYMIGGIKTEAGKNRIIPISDRIFPIVKKCYQNCDNGIIDLKLEEFYEQWNSTVQRLPVRALNPHCCRHTCATILAEQGVSAATIKEILGHKNYQTTLGYTHISLESKLDAINKI